MDSETDQTSGIPADPEQVLALSEQLAGFALSIVQDPETRGVRVEEYLTVLAAAAGEAVLASSGVIDIESNPMNPGGAILGAPINIVLSGDVMSFAEVPADSAMGILIGRLVPDVFSLDQFGSVADVFKHVVEHIGQAEWGRVATSVPEQNQPGILPVKAAFDLRDAVTAVQKALGLPLAQRYVPCVHALAFALTQTRSAIEPNVALTLSLQVLFTMAKMVPVPKSAFDEAPSTEAEAG